MSNRFVWERYTYEIARETQSRRFLFSARAYSSNPTCYYSSSYKVSGNSISLADDASSVNWSTVTATGSSGQLVANSPVYFYVEYAGTRYPTTGLYFASPTLTYVSEIYSSTFNFYVHSGTTLQLCSDPAQGSAVGSVSNGSSSTSTYPQDGVSGNYWYELQGSDNIDAASVGYSNQAPMGGQPITISVTPGSGKVYGGTVRYTYQVQLNGGAWTSIATNSTATSQSYTIPAGTTSFAARVQASDDLGFTSSDYTTGSTLSVTNNLPPTAPGSITIGSVVAGESCTITWTAATDSDGTIARYELERNVDGGDSWTQVFSGNALTYNDTIGTDWATINYRVRAVDDDGDAGPYATGVAVTVNDGYLYFSGPAADMGAKPAPFNFIFTVNATIAGGGTVDGIAVTVAYDDAVIYDEAVTSGQQISLPIDTRLTYAGDHAIVVTAEKEGYLGFTQVCAFSVPDITAPEGGMAAILEDDEGNAIYPFTFARFVRGLGGNDINKLFDRVYSSVYTGTGTSGEGNPNRVRISFEPEAIFVQGAGGANYGVWVRTSAMGQAQLGSMIVHNGTTQSLATVGWDAENQEVSWYATSAAAQLNTSGTQYGILILGGMA